VVKHGSQQIAPAADGGEELAGRGAALPVICRAQEVREVIAEAVLPEPVR
jgi:hypothetical protein